MERMSGVELFALYGDDNRIGAFKMPKFSKRFKKIAKYASMATPYGLVYHGAKAGGKAIRRKMHGDERVGTEYVERLGAAKKKKRKFLPGLAKVGKVTRGITTGVASAFVPKSTLDLLSKLDPTKKKSTGGSVMNVPVQKEIIPVEPSAMKLDTKKIAIIGGIGVGSLVLLSIAMRPRNQR